MCPLECEQSEGKIKPCPVCGGEETTVEYNFLIHPEESFLTDVSVVCTSCDFRGPIVVNEISNDDLAIIVWNATS